MDEAEKYKQRLEAIAEKRRLQEEQDKARREMEDEKLRLQQLKRKSLRDQWLMEGAPLSPTSLDAQGPRSPLWGTQAQEMEKHIDKLQSESQRLAEEQEKLEKQTADGQTLEAVNLADAAVEMVKDVVQNGENKARSETTKEEVKVNQSPLLDKTAVILTNGVEALKANGDHSASERNNQSTTNGPTQDIEAAVSMNLSPALGVSAAEPGQLPHVTVDEEEEEGTLVMRAECVIVTDEWDDTHEELTSQEDQQESMQTYKTPLTYPEADEEGGKSVEEVVKTDTAPASFSESVNSEATELTIGSQPATRDGDTEGSIKATENGAEETKAEGLAKELEDPASVHVQFPANALEGTTVAPVPVYSSETQPSAVSPELEAEGEASAAPEGAEAELKAHKPACPPGQFQEIPLADPQENQRTEAGPGEQEPLLLNVKASNNKAEPAGVNSPASTETQNPTRAGQGEETEAPKHKSCQCCSVM